MSILKGIGKFLSNNQGSLLNAGVGILANEYNMKRQWDYQKKGLEMQQAFNSAEAQKSRDWNLEIDNTKYQRQIADMQNAGVNPALAMNGGVSTQAASNATASSNAIGNVQSDAMSAIQGLIQMKQMHLQNENIKKQNAEIQTDIDLKKSQKDAIDIENGYKADTLKTAIDEANARIDKMLQETRTESYRQSLLITEKLLNEANITRVNELLPFEKAYEEAKTEQARADAAFALVKKASEQSLIDGGYFVSLAKEAGFKADISGSMSEEEANRKVISDLETARRTGKMSNGEDFYKNGVQKHIMTRLYEMRDLLGGFNGLGHVSWNSNESENSSKGTSSSSSSYSASDKK